MPLPWRGGHEHLFELKRRASDWAPRHRALWAPRQNQSAFTAPSRVCRSVAPSGATRANWGAPAGSRRNSPLGHPEAQPARLLASFTARSPFRSPRARSSGPRGPRQPHDFAGERAQTPSRPVEQIVLTRPAPCGAILRHRESTRASGSQRAPRVTAAGLSPFCAVFPQLRRTATPKTEGCGALDESAPAAFMARQGASRRGSGVSSPRETP